MLKVNVAEELQKKAKTKKELSSKDGAVQEAQKLLEYNGAEDVLLLKEIGLAHNLMKADKRKAADIEYERLVQTYGTVFTREDIKEIACNYALKFLRADFYEGKVDPHLVAKIRDYAAELGKNVRDLHPSANFYILAPQALFRLTERKLPTPIADFYASMTRDPLFFYQIEGDGTHYALIHKWGIDFSFWRRVIGWKYASNFNYRLFWTTAFMIPVMLLLSFFFPSAFLISFAIGLSVSYIGSYFMLMNSKGKRNLWKNCYEDNQEVGL